MVCCKSVQGYLLEVVPEKETFFVQKAVRCGEKRNVPLSFLPTSDFRRRFKMNWGNLSTGRSSTQAVTQGLRPLSGSADRGSWRSSSLRFYANVRVRQLSRNRLDGPRK